MEILNNIWISLTTENQFVINIMSLFFLFIEIPITMELFITILNISANKKQKLIYIIFSATLGILCSTLISKPYSNIVTLITMPLAMMFIFKINFLKAIFAEFIPAICITIIEIIISRIFLLAFNINYENCANSPLSRFCINFVIYIILFVLYKFAKKYNFNITILDSISKRNKKIIISNIIFAIVIIFVQMYLTVYYNDNLPSFVIIINIFSLIFYAIISIYSLTKTMKLEKTQIDLEQEKLSHKTLQILHDNTRAFKHDFANIITGIGGYVETNDMAGLKKYYSQLLADCNQVNNFETLSPDVVNNPSVYAVLANKYYTADSLGIKITLESFIDFNKLNMDIYEFTRILGILMDNAIESACECKTKLINVIIRNDFPQNRQLLIIKNTYKNKNLDIDKLSEKGFSTKPNNTGLGLWEVEKIIKRNSNLAKFTKTDDTFFTQQIEIYNE